MSLTARQALLKQIDELRARVAETRFLHLVPRVLVHEPSADGEPCPCCRSLHARVAEVVELPEVVVECVLGRRIYRDEVDADRWAAVLDDADRHDVPLRMSRTQAAVLLDEDGPPHVLASGGNRSAKTTAGLLHVALQWLRRGGPQRRFWLVASTLPKAFRLLEKLFLGTSTSPPILPRALVRSMPETHRASSLLTTLADGSHVDLKFFDGDPGAERLKSDDIVAALVDEAAHLPTPDSLVALTGRCLDLGGRLFLATTPRPDHFLREVVVEPAQAFERLPPDDDRRGTGEHPGARWRVVQFAIGGNPWLDAEEVRRTLAALDKDDPAVRRDFFGEWVSNEGMLWRDFRVDKVVHLDEARHVRDMRATVERLAGKSALDATPAVVARLFQRIPNPHFRGVRATNTAYLLAADFNCHPMSAVVLNVTCDPAAPDDRTRWHVWVVDSISRGHSNSLKFAEDLVDMQWVRSWLPTAARPPYQGCGMICDPTALGRDPTAHRHGRDPHGLAETLGSKGFDARAPQYRVGDDGARRQVHLSRYDSHTLVHRLLREGRLHVAQRCLALVESFLGQLDSGDGIEPLTRSHRKSDRLAGPMDALRYGLWAIFHG